MTISTITICEICEWAFNPDEAKYDNHGRVLCEQCWEGEMDPQHQLGDED